MFATSAACKHYLSLFIALTCIQHAAGKQRYPFRQGELVVPTTLAVEIEYEGRHGAMWKWFELCRVEKVEEGRLLVSTDSGLLRGWVGSIHVVPLKGARRSSRSNAERRRPERMGMCFEGSYTFVLTILIPARGTCVGRVKSIPR